MSTPGSEPQPNTPAEPTGAGAIPPQPNSTSGYPVFQPAPGYPSQPGFVAPSEPAGYPPQEWEPTAGQPYPAPGQPYPAPGQPYPQGYPNPYQPMPKPAKSPWLGRIALIVVAACTVIATAAMGPITHVALRIIQRSGSASLTSEELTAAVLLAEPGAAFASQIATWVGIVAAITGLVAAILGRGRATGIFAIVLGVFAPVIMVIYMVIILLPYLS